MCEVSDGRTRVADEEREDRESKRDRDGAKPTAIFERVELVEKPGGLFLISGISVSSPPSCSGPWVMDCGPSQAL